MILKLISSNIRFDNPADENHDWNGRKEVLKQNLLEFEPHLIATQEGRRPQLEDFESMLDGFSMLKKHRDWIEERMYPSTFVTFDLKALRTGDSWLSETPDIAGSKSFDSTFPRLCNWAEFHIIPKGVEFFFVNVHLDHVQESTRIEQTKVLIEEINKKNTNKLPLIICGDFNSAPNSIIREMLLKEFSQLRDPWNKEEVSSHHKFNGSKNEGSRIDWFLVDERFHVKDLYFDFREQNGIYPSDHYPLKLEILI